MERNRVKMSSLRVHGPPRCGKLPCLVLSKLKLLQMKPVHRLGLSPIGPRSDDSCNQEVLHSDSHCVPCLESFLCH